MRALLAIRLLHLRHNRTVTLRTCRHAWVNISWSDICRLIWPNRGKRHTVLYRGVLGKLRMLLCWSRVITPVCGCSIRWSLVRRRGIVSNNRASNRLGKLCDYGTSLLTFVWPITIASLTVTICIQWLSHVCSLGSPCCYQSSGTG